MKDPAQQKQEEYNKSYAQTHGQDEIYGSNQRTGLGGSGSQGQGSYRSSGGGGGGGGGGGCFPAGSAIATSNGSVPIETLSAGDYVLTMNPATGKFEERPILKAVAYQEQALWEMVFSDGTKLTTTGSHSFQCNGKWKVARKIEPGEIITRVDKAGKVYTSKIVSSEQSGESAPVYNLIVAGGFNFIADGTLAHSFSVCRLLRSAVWSIVGRKQSWVSKGATYSVC